MRSFREILREYNESKVYSFKIGIAGEIDDDLVGRIETAMKKFNLLKFTSGKRTPIQKNPLDFPRLQNVEVTYFDVEVSYPTTSPVIHNYLSNLCSVTPDRIVVKTQGEDLLQHETLESDAPYETLLTQEDMGGVSAQDQVGQNRVMDLLKELESAKSEKSGN